MNTTATKNSRPDPDEIKELLQENPKTAATGKKPSTDKKGGRGLNFLYDIPLQISVEVGRSKILLRDLLKMGEGYVIELINWPGNHWISM